MVQFSSVGGGTDTTLWTELETVNLGASATEIEFSSIASGHTHFIIIGQVRSDRGGSTVDYFNIQFNSDTTATNYFYSDWSRTNTTLGAAQGNSYVYNGGICPGATAATGEFANIRIHIQNNDSYMTNYQTWTGYYDRTNNITGKWITTDEITNIKIFPNTGTNFIAGSKLTLYGGTQ